jgi:hypothetical protein
VEIVCSNAAEHRSRVQARRSGHQELDAPTWQEVAARKYDEWDTAPIVIDTAGRKVEESVAELLQRIEALNSQTP